MSVLFVSELAFEGEEIECVKLAAVQPEESNVFDRSWLFDRCHEMMDTDILDQYSFGTIDLGTLDFSGTDFGDSISHDGPGDMKKEKSSCDVPSLGSIFDLSDTTVVSEELLYASIVGQDIVDKKQLSAAPVVDHEGRDVDQDITESSKSLMELIAPTTLDTFSELHEGFSTCEVLATETSSEEGNAFNAVSAGVVTRKRNIRKSSLITRNETVALPLFECRSPKTEGSSSVDEFQERVRGKKRARGKTEPEVDDFECSETSKRRRPKMYELDDPKAKNAKAAFMNRQKKKEAMEGMKKQNEKLAEENEKMKRDLEEQRRIVEQVRLDLEYEQRKNLAASGLRKVLNSAKDVIESVLPALNSKFGGRFDVEVAPWFSKVDACIRETGTVHDALGGPQMTSKFITLHVNSSDRILRLDYRPEEPNLPNNVPQ